MNSRILGVLFITIGAVLSGCADPGRPASSVPLNQVSLKAVGQLHYGLLEACDKRHLDLNCEGTLTYRPGPGLRDTNPQSVAWTLWKFLPDDNQERDLPFARTWAGRKRAPLVAVGLVTHEVSASDPCVTVTTIDGESMVLGFGEAAWGESADVYVPELKSTLREFLQACAKWRYVEPRPPKRNVR